MVSVIIPVYNSEKTLSACVQSILNQTYSSFELVLIDDGSTDSSGQICDRLQDNCREKNIHCQVIHKSNGGVSSARNCGFEHASGEYFVCVDSDDVVEPCYLEDLVHTAEEHPELGFIISGFRCTSHEYDYIMSDRERLSITDRREYMLLYEKILIQSPCLALYRTDIVNDYGIRMREDLSRGEDILFNLDYLDALDCSSIGVINKANYTYQNEDMSSLYRKYREDLWSVNEIVGLSIAHYLKKWGIDDEASWTKYYNTVFYNYDSVLKNTFHKQNDMSRKKKIAFNCDVLKQERFKEALEKSSVVLSPTLRKAYESGNYSRVLRVEHLQKIKSRVCCILKRK